jgi:hypothetical protein
MIGARIFKGIEFIRVCDLPLDQQNEINKWSDQEIVIKIQTEEGLYSDCIQYKDYVYWFENIFEEATTTETKLIPHTGIKKIGLAFDN